MPGGLEMSYILTWVVGIYKQNLGCSLHIGALHYI